MKREDRRKLREKEKALEKAMRVVSKKNGYKSLMGFPYKIVDGFLYEALISTTQEKSGINPQLFIFIQSKPLILDEIFWKVFNMYEDAKTQPESFHVKGAFTASSVMIDNFYHNFYEEENQEIVAEKILEKVTLLIDSSRKKIFDIDTQPEPHILIQILEQDY